MDDDSYVPQISQMDYSLLGGGPYFDQGVAMGNPAAMSPNFQSAGQSAYAIAAPQHGQQLYGGSSGAMMSSQPGMPPPGYGVVGGMGHEAAYRMGMEPSRHGPFPSTPSSIAGQHQQPHSAQMLSPKGGKQRSTGGGGGQQKPKAQRRGKKEKAADVIIPLAVDSAPIGSPMPQFAAPAQQPLPASFPNIPMGAMPSMSQQMMQQRQMQAGGSTGAQHDPRGKFTLQQAAWGFEPQTSGMQRPNFPSAVDAFQQQQLQLPPYYGRAMGQGASYPQMPAGHSSTSEKMDKPASYYTPQPQQQQQQHQPHQYQQAGAMQHGQPYPPHQDNNAPPAYPVPSGQQQHQQQVQQISAQQWQMGHGRPGSNVSSSAGVQSPHYSQFQPGGGMYQQCHPAAMPLPPQQQQQQQFQQMQQQMHCELAEAERQLNYFYQQPQRTPEMDLRMDQLYQHATYLRNRLVQLQKQMAQSIAAAPSYPAQQRCPPSLMSGSGGGGGSGSGTGGSGAAAPAYPSSSVAMSQPASSSSSVLPPISSQASLQASSMLTFANSNQSAHISPHIPQSTAQAPPYYHPQIGQPSQQPPPPPAAPPTPMRQENAGGGKGVATKGAGPSPVEVMQTGANQVQVNITPEAAGSRTFISVYHQYPSQMSAPSHQAQPTTSTSSAHSSTYPSPSLSSKADSIPPEPLPPKTQQEQYQPYGRAASVVSATPAATFGQQSVGRSAAPALPSTTHCTPSIQQPLPTNTANVVPTPAPPATELRVVANVRRDELFDYPAPPTSSEMPPSQQQQQHRHLQEIQSTAKSADEAATAGLSSGEAQMPKPMPMAAEVVIHKHEGEQLHGNSASSSVVYKPEKVVSPQPPSPSREVKLEEIIKSPNANLAEEQGAVETIEDENGESAGEDMRAEGEQQQPLGTALIVSKEREMEASTARPEVGNEDEPATKTEDLLPEGGASSSSVSAFAQAVRDAANDIQMDDANETVGEEVSSAAKEVDEDSKTADDSTKVAPEPEPELAGGSSRKRGRKSSKKSTAAAGRTRKRKLHVDSEEEEYFDEKDADFVVNKKSPKGSRKRKAVAEKVELSDLHDSSTATSVKESVDLEDFVEKRRSGRKRAEKKSYDEDSKVLDFEEELPLGGRPSTSKQEDAEQNPPEAEPPKEEWIVEKILAMRIAKRKKRKVKETVVPKSSLEEEAPEEESVVDTVREACSGAKNDESMADGDEKEKVPEAKSDAGDVANETSNCEKIDQPVREKTGEVEEAPKVEENELSTAAEIEVPKVEGETEVEAGANETTDADPNEVEKAKRDEGDGETQANTTAAAKPDDEVEEEEWEESMEEEVYVKFKGRSYLHCAWKFVDELEELDRRVVGKINRFKLKNGKDVALYDDEEEYFNEDYIIVDRVLDETYDETEKEHYALVKWRSLGYDECTWELFDDVPRSKIEECRKRNNVVDSCKAKERSRPRPEEWQHAKIAFDKSYKDGNRLRDYQVEGVNWLLFGYLNRQNCILADEMGLGKTVQTITFLQAVFDLGVHGPFLIVVPLSTLHNWEREFETWTHMNAIVYHGSVASRQMLQNYEFYYGQPRSEQKRRSPLVKLDVVITTFETIVNDCEVLRRINYQVCVIDEAHRLKNRNCKLLTNGLAQFQLEHRVLLTGTPLQNSIHELFSLLNFLEPEQFHNSDTFLEQFGQCQTEEQVQKLQDILKPMMLRRLKEDVEKNIPHKEETIIEVQLSNIQKKYYRAILERNFTHLLKGTSVPSLMNTMMELRKCCNHPFLIRGAEDQILAELTSTIPMGEEKSEEDVQLHSLIQSSGKMVLIDKLLPKLRADGHKVLIFSQMVRVLDILEEFLNHRCYPYERIDGNIRGDMRQAAIDRFGKQDSERFVFLLCTRAGGLGINLTAADTVIIFDSDWNPQNDIQAQARCHRIGQTKMVKVYRLITAQTYEREMFDRASLKLGLDKAVLQSSTPRGDNSQQMSRKEVEDLLRKGAYGAVMDEDNEGSKFSEEDIETILQRRTQTIILEPGIKGSTFAKASFKSSDNREDIDILDPEFWQKWAKKANIDVDKLASSSSSIHHQHLIVSEPRSRRRRFEEQNYKATESGEDGIESDEEPGGKPAKGSISAGESSRGGRSAKKRRRAAGTSKAAEDDDEDYVHAYRPDELSFNKAEYFRVEKLLAAWGFGRWKWVKDRSDITLTEEELEHIARTLLLHCLREFRGDERTREFVWQLITPKGGLVGKVKKSAAPSSIYHEGWAASPEYNPPAFAVDSSFQRHVHRHSNKLMVRVQAIEMLKQLVIGDKDKEIGELEKAHDEVQFQIPAIGDPPYKGWDMQCDKSFLMGVFKHGMDNFEAIRSDPKLCFTEKGMKEMPTVLELNNRFKRLMTVLQRQADYAANSIPIKSTKWTKTEEADFMRLLRTYGVKDSNSESVIDWTRFRELSACLKKKSDEAMLEQLYCVLAMCTHQQGGELSAVDKRRASSVEQISAKRAEKLMNRLHLMRKIHAIITTGIHNVRTSLKLCSGDVMPDGWTDAHDEALLVVVDKFGLDHILSRISTAPQFENVCDNVSDRDLLRRVIEICTTLESGKWNGKGSTEIVEDEDELDAKAISALQKAAIVAAAAAMDSSGSGRSTPKAGSSKKLEASRRRGGKEPSVDPAGRGAKSRQPAANSVTALEKLEKDKMRTLMQKGVLDSKMDLTNMNASYLFSLLGMPSMPTSSSSTTQFSSSSQAQSSLQQQVQQLQSLMAMSSMFGGGSAALNNLSANALSCALGGMLQPGPSTSSKEKASSGGGVLNLSDAKKQSAATPSKSTPKAPPLGSSLSSGLSASAVDRLNQMSAAELLALSDLPADTPIPVMHLVDETRLAGERAPKLKNLDEWLGANQQYTVDVMALADAYSPSTPTVSRASASAVGSSKRDTKERERKASDVGGKGQKTQTETGAEKRGEKDQSAIKSKASSSGGEAMDAAAAACRESAVSLAQLENSVIIGVFRRSSGAVLPSDEWPKVKNLLDWLDKNPDCNIQSAYANIETMLPKSYHSRVGGEPVGSSSSQQPASTGSQIDVSSLLPMADSSDLFTQLLASAMNPLGGTASSSSASSKAASSAQQQQSTTTSSLPNTMEALQMQLLLQQAMLGSSLYNPYMSLLASGSGGSLASSMLPATSNANPSDLAAAFTSLLNSTPTSTPAPPTTSKTKSANASAPASASAASQLGALGAELAAFNKSGPAAADVMSNPALLASMLAMGNSMASLFPGGTVESLGGIDPAMMLSGLGDASALWLAAQMPTAKVTVGDGAATTPVVEDAKVVEKATLQSGRQPTKRTMGASSKGKLNLVLEKLSSNSNSTSTPK